MQMETSVPPRCVWGCREILRLTRSQETPPSQVGTWTRPSTYEKLRELWVGGGEFFLNCLIGTGLTVMRSLQQVRKPLGSFIPVTRLRKGLASQGNLF